MAQNKNSKIPMALRVIRSSFPIVERVSPALARQWATYLFFRPIRFPYREDERSWVEKADKFVIDVNGRKVTCYSYGEGTPVLFVHGWSGRAAQGWKFAEIFGRYGYRLIAFDAPGHGHSEGSRTSILEFADIIAFLADNYKIRTLIGHSLGGVASLLAITQGTPARNLLMISSPSIGERVISEFLTRINGSNGAGEGIRQYIERMTDKSFEEYMSLELIGQVRESLNVKIIHDEKDSQVPIEHAKALKERRPAVKLKTTVGLGHSRILTDDEVVSESLRFTSMS